MEIINIPETEKKYPDQWVLFEVTETDNMNQPLKGKLIIHSPNRRLVEQKALKLRDTILFYYLTYSGDPIPTGVEVIL